MILWLDAHISPKLVPWIHDAFGMDVLHVRDLGLREAEDPDIFYKAREADAIVITKDRDIVELLGHFKCSFKNDFLKDPLRRTRIGKSRGEFR